jgi:hypothetical protein
VGDLRRVGDFSTLTRQLQPLIALPLPPGHRRLDYSAGRVGSEPALQYERTTGKLELAHILGRNPNNFHLLLVGCVARVHGFGDTINNLAIEIRAPLCKPAA